MKKNARNTDGFLTSATPKQRVTLDKAPSKKSKVRDGLMPTQERASTSKPKKRETPAKSNEWANDIDSTIAELPGYDNFDPDGFIDNNKSSVKKALRHKPKPAKKKMNKKKKIAIIISSILVFIGAIIAAIWLLWPNDSFEGNWWDVLSNEPLKEDANGRSNVLIFGTAPVDYDGPLLSDTIMVLSINQTDKSAYMISLPRDLWVQHYCPNETLGTSAGKLNETYRCALRNDDDSDEVVAASAAGEFKDKVGEILGLDVQYYAHLSWDGVIDIVDAVGGIDVTIESNNPDGIYDVATGIDFENGEVAHMDGRLALALIRARGAAGGYGLEDSNFARERNQQLVIQALQEKASDVGTLSNPVTVVNSIQALGDNVRSDFRVGELRTIAQLAEEVDTNNMVSLPLIDEENDINLVTNDTINGASVVVPTAGTFDYSEIKQYISESMSSDPMVREGAVVDVLNGSGTEGLASSEADKLEAKGFRIGEIGNTDGVSYDMMKIYSMSNDKPLTKEALKNLYNISPIEWDYPFYYTTDADFIVVVGQ